MEIYVHATGITYVELQPATVSEREGGGEGREKNIAIWKIIKKTDCHSSFGSMVTVQKRDFCLNPRKKDRRMEKSTQDRAKRR